MRWLYYVILVLENPISSTLIGALIAIIISHYYYKKAGDELRYEAEMLRNMVNIIGHGLESKDLAKFNWDENRNMTGVVHFLGDTKLNGTLISKGELNKKLIKKHE